MKRNFLTLVVVLTALVACKNEHPDLKTAFELFKEAQTTKQSIITTSADLKNQATMVDGKIRNEDEESVFAISEVYNHLEAVDKGLGKIAPSEKAVPGHEKESGDIPVLDKKMDPSMILMMQKNYRDSLLIIKSDLDAAATLLNHLKTKFNK